MFYRFSSLKYSHTMEGCGKDIAGKTGEVGHGTHYARVITHSLRGYRSRLWPRCGNRADSLLVKSSPVKIWILVGLIRVLLCPCILTLINTIPADCLFCLPISTWKNKCMSRWLCYDCRFIETWLHLFIYSFIDKY